MKKLTTLAQEAFTNYSFRIFGTYANWGYLSKERQYVWMTEQAELLLLCLEALKKELSNTEPNPRSNASYDRGVLDGIALAERRLNAKFELLEGNIFDQLEEFKERELD